MNKFQKIKNKIKSFVNAERQVAVNQISSNQENSFVGRFALSNRFMN